MYLLIIFLNETRRLTQPPSGTNSWMLRSVNDAWFTDTPCGTRDEPQYKLSTLIPMHTEPSRSVAAQTLESHS